MTEAEWLVCEDPQLMLEHLRGRASDRKLRLFASVPRKGGAGRCGPAPVLGGSKPGLNFPEPSGGSPAPVLPWNKERWAAIMLRTLLAKWFASRGPHHRHEQKRPGASPKCYRPLLEQLEG